MTLYKCAELCDLTPKVLDTETVPVMTPYLAPTHIVCSHADPTVVSSIIDMFVRAYGITCMSRRAHEWTLGLYFPAGRAHVRIKLYNGPLTVEVTRWKGSPVISIAIWRTLQCALVCADAAAAFAALPNSLHLLPEPCIPKGPAVPALNTEQTFQLLQPIVNMINHTYSDVVLEGAACACSLTEYSTNIHYMLTFEPVLHALISAFTRAQLPDTAVLAALALSNVIAAPGGVDALRLLLTDDVRAAFAAASAFEPSTIEQACLSVFCKTIMTALE